MNRHELEIERSLLKGTEGSHDLNHLVVAGDVTSHTYCTMCYNEALCLQDTQENILPIPNRMCSCVSPIMM